jgi:hypothetical protein
MEDFSSIIIIIYLILHSPAIIMLIIGLARLKTKPESAKTLLIISTIYFIIGGGICGSLLM